MRWVGRLFALVGFLLFAAVGTVGFYGYQAATGRNLALLDLVVRRFGEAVAGQRTERLTLDVAVDPEEGKLAGQARLSVAATAAPRRRLYFLLGDSFALGAFRVDGFPEARAYKLWLVTVIDLGRALPPGTPLEIELDYEGRPEGGLFGLGTARVSPRDVQLSVDSFWFPNDLQGQFQAEVGVTLPSYLTVVHAGEEIERSSRGRLQRLRWRYARPVASLSLVAGVYRAHDLTAGETRYRLYLADDVELDEQRVLAMAADADERLTRLYGPAGYPQLSFFVTRKLRRAYNDGAGVMGLSIRYFRRGDYGYNVIAHELAHNWFGATVMEKWLAPGTGGEWLVEGFAEFSSQVVVEERYGREALVRRLAANFWDPRRDGVVGAMSVLDNAVGDDSARDIIYAKGGWVAMMLRRKLGDAVFFPAMRAFIDAHRYRAATALDLENALNESTGSDVTAFFDDWVRSARALDLAIESGEGGLLLRNEGDNGSVGDVVVAGLAGVRAPAPPAATPGGESDAAATPTAASAGEPTPTAPAEPAAAGAAASTREGVAQIGQGLVPAASAGPLNADPDLAYADMRRDNNRYPRARFPLALAVGAAGSWAEIASEVYPWSPATLAARGGDGEVRGTWELPSTVVSWPSWFDEHRLVLNTTDAGSRAAAVELFDSRGGGRKRIGQGQAPAVASGAVYATLGDAIVRWQSPEWGREVVVRHPRRTLSGVAVSPDLRRLAYAVAHDNDMEIRVLTLADRRESTLVAWDRDLRDLVWSADGARLYAGVGGDWDWQVWEIPVDGGPIAVLAREAAAIGNLALSPDGTRLAFGAAPELDYPYNRRELIVLDLAERAARRIDVPGRDLRQVAWQDDATLLAVTASAARDTPFTLPEARSVVRVDAGTGAVSQP